MEPERKTEPSGGGKRTNKSPAWSYMTLVQGERDGVSGQWATCIYCEYTSPKKGVGAHNTTQMLKHLRKKHSDAVNLPDTMDGVSPERQFELDRALALAIPCNGWPTGTARLKGTRFLMDVAVPNYKPCSEATMESRHWDPVYHHIMTSHRTEVDGGTYCQLYLDGWSSDLNVGSVQSRECLGVGVTYLDGDFNRQTCALCVRKIDGSHTAEVLKDTVLDVLKDANLEAKHIIDIATDNASTETSTVTKLRQALGGHIHHTRCFAHTMNLSVRDALMVCGCCPFLTLVTSDSWYVQDPRASETVASVKAIVAFFRSCRLARLVLHNNQRKGKRHDGTSPPRPLVLTTDVVTRWNYTLAMLERFWDLSEFVEQALEFIRHSSPGKQSGFTKEDVQTAGKLREMIPAILNDVVALTEALKPCRQASDDAASNNGQLSQLIMIVDMFEIEMQVTTIRLKSAATLPRCALFAGGHHQTPIPDKIRCHAHYTGTCNICQHQA